MLRVLVGFAGLALMLAGGAIGLFGIFILWGAGGWGGDVYVGFFYAPAAVVGLIVLIAGLITILVGATVARRAD